MNKRLLVLLTLLVAFAGTGFGQTEEELKASKAEKAAQVAELQGQINTITGEIAGIDAQLVKFPRWETGLLV